MVQACTVHFQSTALPLLQETMLPLNLFWQIMARPISVLVLIMVMTVSLGNAALTNQQKEAVLDAHNKYRSHVNPAAANMKKLVSHKSINNNNQLSNLLNVSLFYI